MKLLLDTHALVWWLENSPKLGQAARKAIFEETNDVFVSAVSAIEVSTKHRLGKWPEVENLAQNFEAYVADEGFQELPISFAHALLAGSLRIDHKDPFDRLLLAQTQIENIVLVSNEEKFDSFGVRRIW